MASKRYTVGAKLILSCLLVLIFCSPVMALEHLRLATTTSTENSGLLATLLPPFEQENNCKVDVIAVGTGKAIKLGETGDVDVILVHARSREDKFIAAGFGVDRQDVMYNDFILIGPASDPAEIDGQKDIAIAMAKIAKTKATFVSRGDDSGTHTREKQLWNAARVFQLGSWYLEAGRGMGEVIIMASELHGYTLTDRGTYLAFKEKIPLQIMVAGDPRLFNPYGAIMVNPKRHPHINTSLGNKFLDYLTSPRAHRMITAFRKGGEQLFYVAD